MKSVQIEFVRTQAWKFIWVAAAVVLLVIAATTAVKAWQLREQWVALEQELATLQSQQLQRLAQTKTERPSNKHPRATSEADANRLLQRDWNRLYDAIETKALDKVRLIQLSFDAVTGQTMLEYELEDMRQASDVTRMLNESANESSVWQLNQLDSGIQTSPVVNGKVRGVWRSVLN